jgi:threonine/homoserine/homoserine lactone efflux protein
VGATLAELAPLAVAIAASPFPIVPAILMLFTHHPRATAGAFLCGWAGGVAAALTAFAVLATLLEGREQPPGWAAWVRIVIGLVLLAVGVRQWRGRAASSGPPAWMAALDEASPATALRLGLLLSAANPKIVLLAGAAGVVLGSAALAPGRTVIAGAVFTAVASLTVALPLALHVVAGERALGPLRRLRAWLEVHSATLMAVVLLLIGLLLLVRGVTAL